MPITQVLAAVAVSDSAAAADFYERLFGRPADSAPMPGLAQWELSDGGGTLQVVEDRLHAGQSLLSVVVDDLDGEVDRLLVAGLDPAPVTEATVMAKVSTLSDPDGSVITLVQQS